jgi:hypothetical protein
MNRFMKFRQSLWTTAVVMLGLTLVSVPPVRAKPPAEPQSLYPLTR